AHVRDFDAKLLSGDIRQRGVAALADVGHAAEHRYAAAAVDLHLHAGVGHVIPVDGRSSSAHVGAGGDADTVTERQLAELSLPARSLDGPIDGLDQSARRDLKAADGLAPGL